MRMVKKIQQSHYSDPGTAPSSRLPWVGFYAMLTLLLLACSLSSTVNFFQRLRLTPQARPALTVPLQSTLPSPVPLSTPLPIPNAAAVQPDLHVPTASSGQYQPSAEIIQLADLAAMTVKARNLFYSAQPEIDTDRATFERHCQTQVMRNTVELGCFTTDNRIYLLKLEDPRINAEMTVTAAHEMLHVAYSQMPAIDQTMINGLLETAVTGIKDTDLLQRLKAYRSLEPGQRDNELHSILGTEYPTLGADLEQYYSLYFSDNRRAVVAASQQFNQIFTQEENQISSLQTQIRQMRRQMQTDLAQHKNAAYNQLVPQVNSLIKQYNQAVKEYNALSRELLGEETPAANQ